MHWIAAGAVMLAAAVMLGAFGAHGLRGRLDDYSMHIYERAVFYHVIHALGLVIAPALARVGIIAPSFAFWICALLLVGIVLFSGSLYMLAITGVRILGAITPIGGLAFIAAWLVLAWAVVRQG